MRQVEPRCIPRGHLTAGGAQDPGADVADDPNLLGQRHEDRRRHHAKLRVSPTDQRLGANQRPVGQRDLRLVLHDEFAAARSTAQQALQRQPLLKRACQTRLEEPDGLAALRLGLAQRGLRMRDQLTRVGGVVGEQADPDGSGDHHLPLVKLHRRRHALLQRARHRHHLRRIVKHHGKLVAAQTRHAVAAAQLLADPPANLPEHLVTQGRAKRVIDRAKAVEVQDQHRHRGGLSACAPERLIDAVVQEDAVGQTRERIMVREVVNLRLGLFHIAHVAEHGDVVEHLVVGPLDHVDREPLRVHPAVLAPVPQLPAPAPGGVDGGPHEAVKRGVVAPRLEHPRVAADSLGFRVARDLLESPVDRKDGPRGIGDHQALADALEDRCGQAQLCVCTRALRPLAVVGEGSAHGGSKAGETILEHVVVGTRVERVNGHLLADAARHDDKRQPKPGLAEDVERRKPAEPREPPV